MLFVKHQELEESCSSSGQEAEIRGRAGGGKEHQEGKLRLKDAMQKRIYAFRSKNGVT